MTSINQATHCYDCHNACNCREWRYENMEKALKVIQMWCETDKREKGFVDHKGIIKMCKKGLKGKPDAKDVTKAKRDHGNSSTVEKNLAS